MSVYDSTYTCPICAREFLSQRSRGKPETCNECRRYRQFTDTPVLNQRWRENAKCVGAPPEIFFYEKDEKHLAVGRPWSQWCDSCEVRAECLKYALDADEEFGIWGGLTAKQRRDFRRMRGRTS